MKKFRASSFYFYILILAFVNIKAFALEEQNLAKQNTNKTDTSILDQKAAGVVRNISILGSPYIGSTLVGSYNLYTKNTQEHAHVNIDLSWYRDGVMIPNENNHTYLVTSSDENHHISFGLSVNGAPTMMGESIFIEKTETLLKTNTEGIYLSTQLGPSYSSKACPKDTECDTTSLTYGLGVGYEVGNFAFDLGYNYYTPKYREFQTYDSVTTNELYAGIKYKLWSSDKWKVSVGGGVSYWTTLHTGDVANGTYTYHNSDISPSIVADVGYHVNKYIEPYLALRLAQGFGSAESHEVTSVLGIRIRFGDSTSRPSTKIESAIVVNDFTNIESSQVNNGYLELVFDNNASEPKEASMQKLSEIFNQEFNGCITIIGHASKVGTSKYNNELSAKRAQYIADSVKALSPKLKEQHIFEQYHVGSEFNVYEDDSHNRRVELFYSSNQGWCKK